jgi:exonuclease III
LEKHCNIVAWNVNGLKSKLCIDEFIKYCTSFDIIALTETWAKSIDEFKNSFDGYKAYTSYRPRIRQFGRFLGGIAVFVKQKYLSGVNKIDIDFPHGIFLLFNRKFFGFEKNIIVGTVYIPDVQSRSYKSLEKLPLETLDEILFELKIKHDANIILCGDFNARTGVEDDFISNDSIDHIFNNSFGDWYNNDNFFKKRASKDKVVNSNGRDLLTLCKNQNIHILNGRTKGDKLGNYTFIGAQGKSLIDYLIVSSSLFDHVNEFAVDIKTESDHMPLKWSINCNVKTTAVNVDDNNVCTTYMIDKYRWKDEKTDIFRKNLSQINQVFDDMCTLLNEGKINEGVNQFMYLLKNAAIDMKCNTKNKPVVRDRWFDDECRRLKKEKMYCLKLFS